MGSYELIALDMDGTLLTSDKRLLDETVRDIGAAAAAGKTVALCTGRCVPELAAYRQALAAVRYAIAASGAVIGDLWENKTLYAAGIGRETVLELVRTAERYDAMVHLLTEDVSVVRADQAGHTADFGMGPYQELFSTVSRHVADMRAEAASRPSVPKVNLYFRSAADRDQAYELVKHLPLTFATTEATGLEASPPGVSKGSGLRRLAALLGIPMENVIAVGDGDNDRPMLTEAGLAVAMGNGAPAVKAMADAVTADNDHNGVGLAIRKYML